jgi:uncharacterized SAM-binding protein YcdF (DUF218 family)
MAALPAALLVTALPRAGAFLVVDQPRTSDVIVVLGGDENNLRYQKALELLAGGYGRQVLINANNSYRFFGKTEADHIRANIARSAGAFADRISTCDMAADSTVSEAAEMARCLEQAGARSALIVTSAYHTRRALSTFKTLLPAYEWSAAAVEEPRQFGTDWWKSVSWTKTSLLEWEKLLWWHFVERWHEGEARASAGAGTSPAAA